MPNSKTKKTRRFSTADTLKFIALVLFLVIVAVVFYALMPSVCEAVKQGSLSEAVEYLTNELRDTGAGGVVILLLLQFVQIVLAFIPGELVQLVAGALYGPYFGLLIMVVGCAFTTAIVYQLVHRLGQPFLRDFVSEKWMAKIEKFERSPYLLRIALVLYLLPGMPKDVITYVLSITDIDFKKFWLIAVFARIPSMFASTFFAGKLLDGSFGPAIVAVAIIAVIAVIAFIFREKVFAFIGHNPFKHENKKEAKEKESKKDKASCATTSSALEKCSAPGKVNPAGVSRDQMLNSGGISREKLKQHSQRASA